MLEQLGEDLQSSLFIPFFKRKKFSENWNLSNQRVQLEIISYPLIKGKKRQRNVHKFECNCESAQQFDQIIKTEIAYETPSK